MRSLALALLVTGCAPAHLTAAKNAVDARTQYVYAEGVKLPSQRVAGQGNCADFAIEYFMELKRAGYSPMIPTPCTLPDGQGHAVLDVDGWRLDNRERSVIPVTLSDCR